MSEETEKLLAQLRQTEDLVFGLIGDKKKTKLILDLIGFVKNSDIQESVLRYKLDEEKQKVKELTRLLKKEKPKPSHTHTEEAVCPHCGNKFCSIPKIISFNSFKRREFKCDNCREDFITVEIPSKKYQHAVKFKDKMDFIIGSDPEQFEILSKLVKLIRAEVINFQEIRDLIKEKNSGGLSLTKETLKEHRKQKSTVLLSDDKSNTIDTKPNVNPDAYKVPEGIPKDATHKRDGAFYKIGLHNFTFRFTEHKEWKKVELELPLQNSERIK